MAFMPLNERFSSHRFDFLARSKKWERMDMIWVGFEHGLSITYKNAVEYGTIATSVDVDAAA
jgi:hypothetical protein